MRLARRQRHGQRYASAGRRLLVAALAVQSGAEVARIVGTDRRRISELSTGAVAWPEPPLMFALEDRFGIPARSWVSMSDKSDTRSVRLVRMPNDKPETGPDPKQPRPPAPLDDSFVREGQQRSREHVQSHEENQREYEKRVREDGMKPLPSLPVERSIPTPGGPRRQQRP